jgi:EamA-like transporter family
MVQRIAFAFSPTRTSMSTISEKRYAAAALASVSLIWGYNFIMMKIGLAYAGPFQFATLRFFLCAVCLIPVLISEPASRGCFFITRYDACRQAWPGSVHWRRPWSVSWQRDCNLGNIRRGRGNRHGLDRGGVDDAGLVAGGKRPRFDWLALRAQSACHFCPSENSPSGRLKV